MGSEHSGTVTRERSPRHGVDAPSTRGTQGCAPAFEVALNVATVGRLMADADRGTRQRLVDILQQRHGNTAVQRLLMSGHAIPVQRWPVALAAGTTDCARVVSYLDANSPYRATSGWARTNVRFSWGGDPAYATSGGVTTATVTNPTVSKSVTVDMPRWAPTDAAMASAWTTMTTDLRAHETRHEGIAATWESTLRTNLGSLSLTVADRSLATFRAAVQSEWDGWLGQHQADQTAIDPFTAVLDCSGGGSEGAGGAAAPISGLDGEPDLGGE